MSQKSNVTIDKGSSVSIKTNIKDTINDFLKKSLEKGVFDAVLIPMRVPAGDSFVYVLIQDKSLLKDAFFLPPIMSVQGAKAVSSVTRLGKGNLKIAAIMRPCEVRATVELTKLDQTNLDNITLISFDCPGVMPLSGFVDEPDKSMKLFNDAVKKWDDKIMRPVCKICDKSSMVSGDLHIGTLGAKKDTFYIIPSSEKGKNVLDALDLKQNENIKTWKEKVKENSEKKLEKRKKANKALKKQIGGIDNLMDAFSQCINCHNCMRVCPVCYCRLCYFDSDKVKNRSDDYLNRAKNKGSMRFLPDTALFQIGRMTHMSLSCVSCGSCEDACPMSIPVAQVFSMIADETHDLFDYISGRSIDEPLPLRTFEEEELHEFEDGGCA